MKNSYLKKILIAALSLSLLMGAVFGITALAENGGAEKLAIISQNVSYEGQTHLYYAVHYENVTSPEKITLKVSYSLDDGSVATETVTASEEVILKDALGNEYVCRAFKTPGVDAKNYTTEFTVSATSENGTASDEKTYSVAEYCHEWLCYLSAAEELTASELKIKNAAESTLRYGTSIQALLGYYPDGNTDDYPENYSYLKVTDGSFEGSDHTFVLNGESVEIGFNGTVAAGQAHTGWLFTYLDGTSEYIAGNTFIAKGSATVSPTFGLPAYPEFVGGEGKLYNSENPALRYDFSDPSQLIAPDSATAAKTEIVDGALVFDKTAANAEHYLRFNFNTAYAGNGKVSFESDVMFNELIALGKTFGKIRIQAAGYDYTLGIAVDDNGYVKLGGVLLEMGEWYNLRLDAEVDKETKLADIDIYVNGEYQKTTTLNASATTSERVLFYLYNFETGEAHFDNVYVAYAPFQMGKGDYYSNSEYAGNRFDYENNSDAGAYNKNGALNVSVEEGIRKIEVVDKTKEDMVRLHAGNTSLADANAVIFETDIMVNDKWAAKPSFRIRALGYDMTLATDCWNNNALYIPNTSGAELKVNNWYNLRLEIYKTETAGKFNVKIFLNGEYKAVASISGSATNSADMLIKIPAGAAQGAVMYLDNVFYGYTVKDYVAE